MPVSAQPLIRKQYLVSQRNVSKLERLAKQQGISATAIVRKAIEAYAPERFDVFGGQELMNLVATRLKDSIKDTQSTRKNE